MYFFSFLLFLGGNDQVHQPLDDALWLGKITIKVEGALVNQYIGNRVSDEHETTLFDKEKSNMELDALISIDFSINSLGETTLLVDAFANATQTIDFESKYITEEEVNRGGLNVPQEVQFLETKVTELDLKHKSVHGTKLPIGQINFTPRGRMEKKGEIIIDGYIDLELKGPGRYELRKERQPPSEEYAVLEETANVSGSVKIPVRFSATIKHKREALNGPMQVSVKLENPFAHENSDRGRDIFRNHLKASGQWRLDPVNRAN